MEMEMARISSIMTCMEEKIPVMTTMMMETKNLLVLSLES